MLLRVTNISWGVDNLWIRWRNIIIRVEPPGHRKEKAMNEEGRTALLPWSEALFYTQDGWLGLGRRKSLAVH